MFTVPTNINTATVTRSAVNETLNSKYSEILKPETCARKRKARLQKP